MIESSNFDKTISLPNLSEAALSALKSKQTGHRYSKYLHRLGSNIWKLHKKLKTHQHTPTKPREFDLWCISGQKMRHISVPAITDSVIQHTAYESILGIIDKKLIFDSYGCRRGKGTHRAADRCQYFMRKVPQDSYCLQLDFRKYYYNLDHKILRDALLHLINDVPTVDLIISQFPQDRDVGMNVGAMISQIMGLVYLNEFDHYVKRVLKVKYYIRYVDDVVMLGLTKEECHKIKDHLTKYVADKFHLTFSKAKIIPLSKGVNFVGYRTWPHKRIIRKRSMKVFKRNVRKGNVAKIASSLAHAKRTSSLKGMLDYIDKHLIVSNKETE